jgi:HSP20 family protein
VTLEIRGRTLVISGERRAQEAEGRLYQQIEIGHGPFKRAIELGADVDAERASAGYDDGILRVEIPLAQSEESPRRIQIEGA